MPPFHDLILHAISGSEYTFIDIYRPIELFIKRLMYTRTGAYAVARQRGH